MTNTVMQSFWIFFIGLGVEHYSLVYYYDQARHLLAQPDLL